MQTVCEIAPLLDYCKARKHFYPLLQLLFYQPLSNQTMLQLKKSGNLQEFQNMDQGGQLLSQFFEQTCSTELQQIQEAEFNRLFVGPGPILASPWESVYRSKEHLLFDKTTYQVREQFHQFGLQFIHENNEPDDHLILELEFMAYLNDLCLQEEDSEKLAELLTKQIQFLDDHLCQWIPLFTDKIIKATNSDLYKGAGLLLHDFINFDAECLKEIKEELFNVR